MIRNPKKGDYVKVLPSNWDGQVGIVESVDGFYVCVKHKIQEGYYVVAELYKNELERITKEEYFLGCL